MIGKELDNLKYRIYKKSGKADYLTYKQFVEQENVAYTFGELQKRKIKKDLKNNTKGLYNSNN